MTIRLFICFLAAVALTSAYSDYDVDVLKKTIWLEARGEPRDGQVGVAHVIKNRANANRGYWGGNTIAGVSLHPYQFEAWNNRRPEHTHPQGALYYNNPDKEGYPPWTNNVRRGVKIANHQFYNEYPFYHITIIVLFLVLYETINHIRQIMQTFKMWVQDIPVGQITSEE